MIKLLQVPDVKTVGHKHQKPTAIVTSASWMLQVKLRCGDVRPHYHVPGGLQGLSWDPVSEEYVWLTSKAAEYPWGLCDAWAAALQGWLCSADGELWLRRRTLYKTGPNQLVRLEQSEPDASAKPTPAMQRSKAELREEENLRCTGGLRDPRRAVAKSPSYQQVGRRIRQALDLCVSEAALLRFEAGEEIEDALVQQARQALHAEFEVNEVPNDEGYHTELLKSMLHCASDADAVTPPNGWSKGCHLGSLCKLSTREFSQQTDELSAAIKASPAM